VGRLAVHGGEGGKKRGEPDGVGRLFEAEAARQREGDPGRGVG
jgi:hypothetical protein